MPHKWSEATPDHNHGGNAIAVHHSGCDHLTLETHHLLPIKRAGIIECCTDDGCEAQIRVANWDLPPQSGVNSGKTPQLEHNLVAQDLPCNPNDQGNPVDIPHG